MITPLDQHQFLSEPERILLREWRKTRECELILTILNTATRFPAANDEAPRSAEERIGEVNAANRIYLSLALIGSGGQAAQRTAPKIAFGRTP